MALEFPAIAASAVKILSPFMPYLLDAAKSASEKLGEVIGEHGGDAAWKTAQTLWSKITGKYKDDAEVHSLATLVSTKPEDESYQMLLAKALGTRLEQDPNFTREIFNLLGGQKGIQKVLADKGSFVANVAQHMKGAAGEQTTSATDHSTIYGVNQTIE